jgi:cholesterol transport system auxiliary component
MLMPPDFPVLSRHVRRACLALALSFQAVAVAGCSGGSAARTFDLTAPREVGKVGGSRAALVIAEPTAVQVYDSDRIIVRDAGGALSFLGGGQWSDRLPKLIQTRLIQTFENASRLGAVGRPGERIVPDWQMNCDIRMFSIDSSTGEAVVEISAKLIGDRTGRVAGARLFTARVPAGAIDAESAALALDKALSDVLIQIVRWAQV